MRKYRICAIALAALLLTSFRSGASAEQAVVTGNGVNVRSGPGTAYSIFTSVDSDTTVEVLNRANPDWYYVSWDGNSGYISAQFLTLSEEDSSAVISVSREETAAYINGMYVCLRSAPDTSSTILGTYSTGKALTVTGSSGDWIAVRIDGKEGFVSYPIVSLVTDPDNFFGEENGIYVLGKEYEKYRKELEEGKVTREKARGAARELSLRFLEEDRKWLGGRAAEKVRSAW